MMDTLNLNYTLPHEMPYHGLNEPRELRIEWHGRKSGDYAAVTFSEALQEWGDPCEVIMHIEGDSFGLLPTLADLIDAIGGKDIKSIEALKVACDGLGINDATPRNGFGRQNEAMPALRAFADQGGAQKAEAAIAALRKYIDDETAAAETIPPF